MRVMSCGSPYGKGGLGQHFAQLVEESRQKGVLRRYYAAEIKPGDEGIGHKVSFQAFLRIRQYTPLRFSSGWSSHLKGEFFDRKVATRLTEPAEMFMGFVGGSLRSFRCASKVGFKRLELVVPNGHVDTVKRLFDRAQRRFSIEESWLNEAQRKKTLREYEMADVIYVHSEYTRRSFIREGFDPERLQRMYLKPDKRFTPPPHRLEDGVFRVVYVGSITTTKGIPLLLEAFSRLSIRDAELTLVGGWATRGMRRYMETWMNRDPRIRVMPGDPLPHLQAADVYVHPSYHDGFGYAPMEAMQCGVPVIVTEDTGMREYVREGENGFVVPSGSWEAILDRLEFLCQHDPLPARTRGEINTPV